MSLHARKPDFVANKQQGADQPARMCSLIGAFFFISFLKCTISKFATCNLSRLNLVYELDNVAKSGDRFSRDDAGPGHEKTCLRGFAMNKGTYQPVHPDRLSRAFVVRFLECIIFKLASSGISIFTLVSVAGETGLNLTLSETQKTVFLGMRPISHYSSSISFSFSTTRSKREHFVQFSAISKSTEEVQCYACSSWVRHRWRYDEKTD